MSFQNLDTGYKEFRDLMAKPWARREWLKMMTAGVAGWSMSGWLGQLAAQTANNPQRRRSCILMWMSGGPSQIDTFDPKPGHVNGGLFRPIASAVPGIQISQHLPQVARNMRDIAVIRSMSTREADHARGTYFMHTGYPPSTPVHFPTLGSVFSKELGQPNAELPNFVSIVPDTIFSPPAFGPGFLGPQYAPLVLGDRSGRNDNNNAGSNLRVPDLNVPASISARRSAARIDLLNEMQREFLETRSTLPSESNQSAYQQAVTLMRSRATRAFNLEEEPAALRDRYGRNTFGQGCLLARRLVEVGVPFVEISLTGWDTHGNNFETVRRLSETLDPAWATLMEDLRSRGLLSNTLIVWMGEFGRTPGINGGAGRDHWANSWSTVLAGGGIRGGQAYGQTSAGGTAVEGRPIRVPDFIATIARALGIDGSRQNMSNVGRPIRVVDPIGEPIQEVLA